MSHFSLPFNGKALEYRFDFYEQTNSSIEYKDSFDNSPELDLNYKECKLVQLREHKPGKKDDEYKKTKYYYYPGFTMRIQSVRDPKSKILQIFLPAIVIGTFLYFTFWIEEFHERLVNLIICQVIMLRIMQNMRSELPEISHLTWADFFLMAWTVSSLLPIVDCIYGFVFCGSQSDHRCLETQKGIRHTIAIFMLIEIGLSLIFVVMMYKRIWPKLYQKTPE